MVLLKIIWRNFCLLRYFLMMLLWYSDIFFRDALRTGDRFVFQRIDAALQWTVIILVNAYDYVYTFLFSRATGNIFGVEISCGWHESEISLVDDICCPDVICTSSGSVHVIRTGQQLCIKPTGFLVALLMALSTWCILNISDSVCVWV